MLRRGLGVLVVSFAVVSGCSNSDETVVQRRSPTPEPTPTASLDPPRDQACSGDVRGVIREPTGLPGPVVMMRNEIIRAATRCDYDSLEQLAFTGSASFSYSFGESSDTRDGDPSTFWQREERSGRDPLLMLLRMLARPYGTTSSSEGTIYVWPSVAGEARPPDDDWLALERSFGEERVEQWRRPEGYVGPRVGITATGDWIFYVSGD